MFGFFIFKIRLCLREFICEKSYFIHVMKIEKIIKFAFFFENATKNIVIF